MRDGAGAEVVLLMDVPVENGHVLPVLQQIDGLAAVLRGPVPLRGQVEERRCVNTTMGASAAAA